MANKLVKKDLRHYYEETVGMMPISNPIQEPDKTKNISEMTLSELRLMMERLRVERETQDVIRILKRNSGERDSYEHPFKIDTKTPIDQLYHHGILGMKWGVRRFQNKNETKIKTSNQKPANKPNLSLKQQELNSQKRKQINTNEFKNAQEVLKDKIDQMPDSQRVIFEKHLKDRIADAINPKELNYEEVLKWSNGIVKEHSETMNKIKNLPLKDQKLIWDYTEDAYNQNVIDSLYQPNMKTIDHVMDPSYKDIIIKELKRKELDHSFSNLEDYIQHHGILGMKWGIRRFQNKDGTRTTAGKKREREQQQGESDDHVKSREAKSKATEGLSNEELRKLNERLQLEATYKNLTAEKVKKAESFIGKALRDGGQQALTEFSKGLFLGGAKLLVKEISPQLAEAGFKIKEKKD